MFKKINLFFCITTIGLSSLHAETYDVLVAKKFMLFFDKEIEHLNATESLESNAEISIKSKSIEINLLYSIEREILEVILGNGEKYRFIITYSSHGKEIFRFGENESQKNNSKSPPLEVLKTLQAPPNTHIFFDNVTVDYISLSSESLIVRIQGDVKNIKASLDSSQGRIDSLGYMFDNAIIIQASLQEVHRFNSNIKLHLSINGKDFSLKIK